jgi:hypothetical protein
LKCFFVAIVVALLITVLSVSLSVKLLAIGTVSPFIVLTLTFIFYCKRGRVWSFAGASVLGVAGVMVRVIVSAQPSLEVGGGLPIGVTALYIVLGSLVAFVNYESVLELRN